MKWKKISGMMFIVTLMLVGGQAVFAASSHDSLGDDPIIHQSIILGVQSSNVYVNGKPGKIDERNENIVPFIDGGYTLVPLRFVSETLGAKIEWDGTTGQVILDVDGKKASVRSGSDVLMIDGESLTMNTPSRNRNGTVYLPLRHMVEDLFGKHLFYKNGIIIISEEAITVSESMIDELKKAIMPKIVLTGGFELLHVHADGSYEKQDLGYSDMIRFRALVFAKDARDGHFYIQDNNAYATHSTYKIWNGDGETVKSILIPSKENLSFEVARDGYLYFNGDGQIVKIHTEDESRRETIGPGTIRKGEVFFEGDTLWFTDPKDDYAIFQLKNGIRTKISADDSYLKYGDGEWLYYNFYEQNRWSLYRMHKDGSATTKLTGNADVAHSLLVDHRIYYLDNATKSLLVMNADGSGKRTISRLTHSGVHIFAVEGSEVFYSEEDQRAGLQSLYKVNVESGVKQQIVSVPLQYDRVWRRFENVRPLGDYVVFTIHHVVYIAPKDGAGARKLDMLHTGSGGDILHLMMD